MLLRSTSKLVYAYLSRTLFQILSLLVLLLQPAYADTAGAGVPTRADALAKGDRIILNTDVPIFRLDTNAGTQDNPEKACAPSRSQIEIESAPQTITTTTATAKSGGDSPLKQVTTKTSPSGTVTSTESIAVAEGDTVNTTTATTATARIVRVGPSKLRRKIDKLFGIEGASYEVPAGKDSSGNTIMVAGCRKAPKEMLTVSPDTTYSFTTSELDGYSTERFGLTYGVVVVPNKVIIANRAFISSSSVLPYVGYEAWGPSAAGALVFAAGVGTTPSSVQPTGTKATFSVATGLVGSIAGVFKVGVLVGVDTQGKNSGFQYQGKPWVGISLGAGTQ